MAVDPVAKINLISLNKHKDQIIDLLHNAGVVQVLAHEDATESNSGNTEYNLAQVKFALKFLKKYEDKKPLLDKLKGEAVELTQNKFEEIIEKFDYTKIVGEIADLEADLNKDKNNITKYQSEIEALQLWKGLSFVPAELGETEFTTSMIGGISKEDFETFQKKSKQYEKSLEIVKIAEDDKKQYLVIIMENPVKSKIKEILVGWEEAAIPYPQKTPAEAITYLNDEIAKAEKNILATEKKIKTYAEHSNNLKVIFDYLTWQLDSNNTKNGVGTTEETFALMAWIGKDHIKPIEERINKITNQYAIEELEIKEGESIPVPLENNKTVYPFEMVTGIYGMPLSKEPDPTPYLMGFFIIFFGMCLTDAGYGLVLALASFLAIKLFKIPREKSKLFKVLIWGGVSTFIIGALFGGWFGIAIDTQLPADISDFLQKIRIIDPIKDPITVLIITLLMGVVQILTGITISMYWKIKNGKTLDGILDDGVWIYFILSIMFWVATLTGVLSESLSQIAVYMIYAGVAALILTQGRKEKNIFLKLGKGVGSLYGVVGYFSDILSYSRLLALGLATGIIAMVINMIGMLVVEMVPYVGWVLAIIIFIGGHLFNMVINVLGAFIHSSRLQFVEFFSKFMEGGGSRFKPFRKEAKFINIIK
ncbi:MAG: V-type ATP synthase subunit I [Patescibacteria group bacterium]